MSKIEKALRRARGDQKLVLVSPRPRSDTDTSATDTGRQLVPNTDVGLLSELEGRARSSAAIALMRESELLDRSALDSSRIIYPELSEDATVQAFREIRTKILQRTQGRNCIVMVTGVVARSGSTFAALNLSAAFAFDSGKTALLMDCNLRRPALNRMFLSDGTPGLTDYLENPELDISQVIHPVGIERLRVIPAGQHREIPAEYFTSVKMKRLLDDVRRRYPERFIVIDAPPMTDSADTQILAELCDLVVLVVPYGKVSDSQIGACIKAIDAKKLVGAVFNDEPRVPTLAWKRMVLKLAMAPIRWLSRTAQGRSKSGHEKS